MIIQGIAIANNLFAVPAWFLDIVILNLFPFMAT